MTTTTMTEKEMEERMNKSSSKKIKRMYGMR